MVWILGVITCPMVVTGFRVVLVCMSSGRDCHNKSVFNPGVGDTIVTWLWGGYAVGNPTLNHPWLDTSRVRSVHWRRSGSSSGSSWLGSNRRRASTSSSRASSP